MRNRVQRALLLAAVTTVAVAATFTPGVHAATPGVCGDLEMVVIGGAPTCTHGGDALVPDVGPASRNLATRSPVPQAPCPGDGRSGRRIHVLLGYPSDTHAPDAAAARPLIKQTLALADQNLDAQSASESGQHYRFWCFRDRAVTITVVRLTAIGADTTYTFTDVANGLDARGFHSSAFVYVAFVANIDCCYPYGGQGSLALDDRPDPATNANNGAGPRYSMIRFGLGDDPESLALAFQHETGHNLGAVQDSAPHTSGAFHCYEINDVMCYNDGGSYFSGGGSLIGSCPGMSPTGMYAFDCNGDDYYNVAPASRNYLADHWNVADSSWLTRVGASGQ